MLQRASKFFENGRCDIGSLFLFFDSLLDVYTKAWRTGEGNCCLEDISLDRIRFRMVKIGDIISGHSISNAASSFIFSTTEVQ